MNKEYLVVKGGIILTKSGKINIGQVRNELKLTYSDISHKLKTYKDLGGEITQKLLIGDSFIISKELCLDIYDVLCKNPSIKFLEDYCSDRVAQENPQNKVIDARVRLIL